MQNDVRQNLMIIDKHHWKYPMLNLISMYGFNINALISQNLIANSKWWVLIIACKWEVRFLIYVLGTVCCQHIHQSQIRRWVLSVSRGFFNWEDTRLIFFIRWALPNGTNRVSDVREPLLPDSVDNSEGRLQQHGVFVGVGVVTSDPDVPALERGRQPLCSMWANRPYFVRSLKTLHLCCLSLKRWVQVIDGSRLCQNLALLWWSAFLLCFMVCHFRLWQEMSFPRGCQIWKDMKLKRKISNSAQLLSLFKAANIVQSVKKLFPKLLVNFTKKIFPVLFKRPNLNDTLSKGWEEIYWCTSYKSLYLPWDNACTASLMHAH